MRDVIADAVGQVVDTWKIEAAQRRKRSSVDPVADNLESCASELQAKVEQALRDTAYLSVADYADAHGSTPQTIRRLCLAGLLEGAVKDANDDWRIPRDAKRKAKA